jgi:O-antigen/teichoic acid export membrane protein
LVALTVLFRIDMSMLAIFKPSRVVGQYGAAYKLLETTAFFSWAVNVALLPSLARLSTTTTPTAGFVYQRGLKLLVAITLPFAVAVAVLAGPIISIIYGAQYHRAALALALLAPTIALFPISALTSQLFFTQGRRPTVAIVYALVALENIALNLILIPRLSLQGAAAGTSISELLVASSLVLVAGKLRGRLEIRRMLTGPVLASASVGVLLTLLHGSPAVGVCLAIVAYFAVLLGHERIAFPDDFAVINVLIGQLRARLTGSATSGTLQ